MKKILLIVFLATVVYVGYGRNSASSPAAMAPAATSPAITSSDQASGTGRSSSSNAIESAFNEQKSGVQVQGEGVVSKILADDNDGSRHQRFILSLPSGQTLLIAHNIDVAPRIAALKPGDSIAFNGVYEWNAKGGVVHWTHHDPGGRHPTGWLRHGGQTYQ